MIICSVYDSFRVIFVCTVNWVQFYSCKYSVVSGSFIEKTFLPLNYTTCLQKINFGSIFALLCLYGVYPYSNTTLSFLKIYLLVYMWLRTGLLQLPRAGAAVHLQCKDFTRPPAVSLVAEHRLSELSLPQFQHVHGLHSCGMGDQLSLGMGALPGPGIKPVSPVLADRFFNTEPPEKLQDSSYSFPLWFITGY